MALTLLGHASMPLKYWDHAFLTATHIINRTPMKVLDYDTPIHRLLGVTPNYSTMRVFGCACWPSLRPYNRTKLQFRFVRCAFFGYNNLHKGYKCSDISSRWVYISRDVIFDENIFPFVQLHPSACARYSAEVLLLHPSSGVSSDFHVTNILPNPDSQSFVLLPFNVLQPLKILAPDPAVTTATKADPLLGSVPTPAATAGADTQEDPPNSGPGDSPGPHLPSTSGASSAAPSDLHAQPGTALPAAASSVPAASTSVPVPATNAPRTRLQYGIHKPKIYSDGTIRYGNLAVSKEPQDLCAALDDPN
jgi:hypothetical protein